MLKYNLVENLLTERPDDYAAQTIAAGSYDKNAIIDLMLRRGNLLTRTDILAVMNGLEEVIADIVRDGATINLPLFNTSFSISGVFDTPMDTFDPTRHKLNVNLTKGALLRKVESEVRPMKTDTITPQPSIVEVKDAVSGKTNETLTSGGVIQLWGSNLKIAGNHPDIGLWFVPETGAPIKSEVVVTNKPSSLIAMIPTLPKGNYTVKVVTQSTAGSVLLKTPRWYVFEKMLEVK